MPSLLGPVTAVTTNTRLRRVFFLCWNLSFGGRQSTVSMVFSRVLTEQVPSSSLNELTRAISNDHVVFNYFIKMKDYIVEPTRSLRAEWNSRNTLYGLLKVLRLFIYLIAWNTGAADDELQRIEYKFKETKDIIPTRDKVSSEWRLFSKMNFCNLQIYLSFFMLSNTIQN